MSVSELDIACLKDTVLNISRVQCDYYSEGCIVALEDQGKSSSVELQVTGDSECKYKLNWDLEVNKNGWKEPKKFTENGAVAISYFLAEELTEYSVASESIISTGVDYWLGYKRGHPNFDEFNFMNARLEISGILKENKANSFQKRINDKFKQTQPTDGTGIPAFVSVVEFSTPKAFFSKKIL